MNTKQKLFKQITGHEEAYNMHLQGPGDEDILQAAKDGDFDYIMRALKDYTLYDYIEDQLIERKHSCKNGELVQVTQAIIDYVICDNAEAIYDSLV